MIRLCHTVATPECEHPDMLTLPLPPSRSFQLHAQAGYATAELMARDPAVLNAKELRRHPSDDGLALSAVKTGQLRKDSGLQLFALDARARREAVDALRRVIDFSAKIGARVVNLGPLRGTLPPGPDRQAALEHAAQTGVAIALEHQCRHVSNWLNTVAETCAFIRRLPPPQPGPAFDSHHALLEEPSMTAALVRARPHPGWVQISDSHRGTPGSGRLHFGEFIRVLRALGHEGYLSVECTAAADPALSALAARDRLAFLLEELDS